MSGKARLWRREILPFLASFLVLAVVALLADAVLHLFDAVWIGRYLGIPGTLMIIASTAYSARKRKLLRISAETSTGLFTPAWVLSLTIPGASTKS